jgi:hypothetical protein
MLLGNILKTRLDKVREIRHSGFLDHDVHAHTHPGGSLGWKAKGSLDPQFEAVAFGLETSTTGNPKFGEAKTGFGYHIIMVEGRK